MYNKNPYRIIGLESNSGLRLIQKNLSKIKAYLKIEKHLTLPYELSFFNLKEINRSHSVVLEMENKILLDSNKIKYALFWFINENSFDEIALSSLNKGNFVKSEGLWRKVIKDKPISKKNFSAYNNLSTLLFLKSLSIKKNDNFENNNDSKKHLEESFKLKSELIFSDYIYSFSKLICGNENEVKREDLLDFFIESISLMLNENFSKPEISKIIKASNKELSDVFSYSLISTPLNSLQDLINDANNLLNENHSKGIEIGKDLIKSTLSNLKLLKNILGVDDIKYQSISDKLANQIMQCGILCFNKTKDDKEFLSSYEYAKKISIKEATKKRAKESIDHCKEEALANICKFCKSNEISKYPMKVEMHKMNYDNTYTYFKDGGLEIHECISCRNTRSSLLNKTFLYTILTYAALNVISILIFYGEDLIIPIILILDLVFLRFNIWKGLNKQFNKPYLVFISKHPQIIDLIIQGYKHGMP